MSDLSPRPDSLPTIRWTCTPGRRCRVRLAGLSAAVLVLSVAPAGGTDPQVAPAAAVVASSVALPITAEAIRPHIAKLAGAELRGRQGEDAYRTAQYLADQFAEFGLQPLFEEESYFQPIPGGVQSTTAGPATTIVGRNVGGWIPGSDPELRDEFVMVTAHYDHLGVRGGRIHPGADDNASGVSMLLETARVLAQPPHKPRRSIVFVGFDLEEHLLWGSRWFAAHPPWDLSQVKLFITADMIGRSLGDLPLSTVFVLGSERAPQLRTVLDEVDCPPGLEMLRLGADLIGTRSDYGPFRDRQVPFLFFSTGEHGDYHTPEDTADRVNCQQVARISTVILRIALMVADQLEPPVWTDVVVPDLDEARTVHRITQLVLEADTTGDHTLNSVQRLFVSQVHTKTGNALKLGRLTNPERVWLTRAAQVLLLSVF